MPGNYYLLEKFPGYWGGDVAYDQIRITITPSVSTQELQLQQGQFDLITKGLPIPDVLKYQKNPDYEVPVTLGGTGNAIWINPNRPMFADKKLRQALVQAIDRTPIVQTSYGGLVPVQKGFWIDKLFPPNLDPISDTFDTAPLQALVAKLPDKNVDLAWGADGGAPVQQMAELVQTQLAAVGLNVTVRQLPTAQVFDLANQPQAKRPDLFIDWLGGDALHLDTVLRIMLRTGAKPLNLFSFSYPELDRLMDEAILQPTTEKMNAIYVQATNFVMDQAIFVPLCFAAVPDHRAQLPHRNRAGLRSPRGHLRGQDRQEAVLAPRQSTRHRLRGSMSHVPPRMVHGKRLQRADVGRRPVGGNDRP